MKLGLGVGWGVGWGEHVSPVAGYTTQNYYKLFMLHHGEQTRWIYLNKDTYRHEILDIKSKQGNLQ